MIRDKKTYCLFKADLYEVLEKVSCFSDEKKMTYLYTDKYIKRLFKCIQYKTKSFTD